MLGPPLKDSAQVKAEILEDAELLAELKQLAEARGRSLTWARSEAVRLLEEIGAKFRISMIQLMFWFFTPIWQRIYHGVEVDEEGLEKVRQAARRGPLVLVPSHKSHVDYLIISYIFHLNNLVPPHIAAGINLSFWPLGAIFRRAGAFFLRRSFKGDPLYGVVFRAYVRKLISEGFAIEFFIEGGRSRTGKLLPPRLGLLSMIVEAALGTTEKRPADVTFVPISVGYERIIEARSYTQELGGGHKKAENLGGLLAARRVLNRRYGRLYVSFGEPLALAEVLGPAVSGPAAPRRLVQHLGERLVHGIEQAAIINPVALVALALMAHPRRGMAREELLVKVGWLLALARERGLPLSRIFADPLAPLVRRVESSREGPLQETAAALAEGASAAAAPAAHAWGAAIGEIVDEAVELLSREGLVGVHRFRDGEAILTPVETRRLAIDYYKNMGIHLLAPCSLVACAALACGSTFRRSELVEEGIALRSLLRLEFQHPPLVDPAAHVASQVDLLIGLGLLAGGGTGEGTSGEGAEPVQLHIPRG
ncbi:MAG: hypothetical protein FJ125_17475, partial [Deltaproteobacteria bacterium]|nr:hypothetical protein [Deltaproteobacteria bacterium]